jgi:hypothetical protein
MVRYRVLEPMNEKLSFGEEAREGLAEDLSAGGLSLSGDFLLPRGAIISIKFRVVDGGIDAASQSFELRGEVRHCRGTGGRSYRSGIRFEAITQKDILYISEHTARAAL